MDAWHRPAAWLSGERTELKGRAEHRVPFPGSPYGEKPQRQAGLSGPDPDGATLVRAPGIPPAWDTQLGQLPLAFPKKVVQAGTGLHCLLDTEHWVHWEISFLWMIFLPDVDILRDLTPLPESPPQPGSPSPPTEPPSQSYILPGSGGWGRGKRSWLQGQCAALGCACSHVPGMEGQPGCGGGGML